MKRVVAVMNWRAAWVGCAVLALCLLGGWAPAAWASTLNPKLLPKVEAATFEVVAAKPTHDPLTYARPLPMNLIPYQQRTDKYHSIGTAFAIGPNRYVTAGHVLRAGLNSLWGPLELRDSHGHVYAIDKILKFSLRRDFVVFSLKDPPKPAATLVLDTHPALNSTVYAVGNALGTGVVIRDGLYTSSTPEQQDGAWKWIRFSAAASPGNSGGPLLDANGKVIGVVLMKSPDENLNYALPISEVLQAPKDLAEIDKQIPYGFPLFQDTLTNTFKGQFKLPLSLAQFNASYLKLLHGYVDGQLKAILAQNASTLFPHGQGSQRLLYAEPVHDLFPRMLTRQGNGDWIAGGKVGGKVQLADNGFLRLGIFPNDSNHIALFHLRRPDSMAAAKLYGHPEAFMRLFLKSGFMRRTIKSTKTRITDFGKPVLNIAHTDAWQRHWRVLVWPVPYGNGFWIVCTLPTPDGYVGFFMGTRAANEHDSLTNMEAMTDFFYTSYEGSLAQWQDFLKQTSLLPAAFKNIHMDIRVGHAFSYQSKRFTFTVTPKVQAIDAQSRLALQFSFFHDRGKVAWGVSGLLLLAKPHGKDFAAAFRWPNAQGDPSEAYQAVWDKVLNRQAPNNGVASQKDDAMLVMGVVGGTAKSKPGVLYTAVVQANGQPSQKVMQAKLGDVSQGMHVLEH